MHEVNIEKVNRGFIVRIGCQRFVFEDYKYMSDSIAEYFIDPKKAEEKFVEKDFSLQDRPASSYRHIGDLPVSEARNGEV